MNRTAKLDKANIGDIFSLTPLQEGMLFYYLRDPQGDMFFEQVALHIGGSVDPALFQKAWNRVVETNGMLRAVFRWKNVKRPVQVVLKSHRPDVRFIDYSGNAKAGPDELFQGFLEHDRHEKFDLLRVPFRVSLCRFSEADCRIVLSHHHILYDGWSTGIILEEFFEAYRQLQVGESGEVKQKLPFSRFVKWLNNQDTQAFESFWNRYLDGFAVTTSQRKEVVKTLADFGDRQCSLPESLRRSVESFASEAKITPAALYHATWGLLLQRYSGRRDVLFDTTVAGRPPDIEGADDAVGLFINTIPCRVKIQPDDSAGNFLSGFQAELQERQKYENVPIHNLELPTIDGGGDPFRSLLVMENYPVDRRLAETSAGLPVMAVANYGINDYDLTLLIKVIAGVEFQFIYNKGLFDSNGIDSVAGAYFELLENIVGSPSCSIEESIQTLSRQEKRMLEHIAARVEADPERLEAEEVIAPRTVTEARLQTIFAAVLKMDSSSISIDNDFFEFGGHSMRASQLVSRIQQEFNVQFPLIEVFQLKTIRAISGYIDRNASDIVLPVIKYENREYYPLSSAQMRMFVLQQNEEVGMTYNIPRAFIIEGELDVSRLENAFRRLIVRNESLRTAFGVAGSQPVQRVLDHVEFSLSQFEADEAAPDAAIHQFVRPFDVSRPPLLRAGVAAFGHNRYLLVIDIHHIVSDGFSNFLLLRDLIAFYRRDPLPALDIQYKDYALWEQCFKSSAAFNRQRQFWLERFKTMPAELNFPALDGGKTSAGFKGDAIYFDIDQTLTCGIRELASSTNTTVFNVMLAAYYVLLSRYTRQEDIVVGFPVTGRSRPEFQQIAGMFVNMLPLRCFVSSDQPFVDFLCRVRDSVWSAMENQDFPFNELVLALGASGDRVKNPLFKTAFTMHDMNHAAVDLESIDLDALYLEEPATRLVPYLFRRDVAAFEFQMVAREKKSAIEMFFDFSLDVFSRETAENIIRRYREVLENVVRNRSITPPAIEMSVGFETVRSNLFRAELDDFDF